LLHLEVEAEISGFLPAQVPQLDTATQNELLLLKKGQAAARSNLHHEMVAAAQRICAYASILELPKTQGSAALHETMQGSLERARSANFLSSSQGEQQSEQPAAAQGPSHIDSTRDAMHVDDEALPVRGGTGVQAASSPLLNAQGGQDRALKVLTRPDSDEDDVILYQPAQDTSCRSPFAARDGLNNTTSQHSAGEVSAGEQQGRGQPALRHLPLQTQSAFAKHSQERPLYSSMPSSMPPPIGSPAAAPSSQHMASIFSCGAPQPLSPDVHNTAAEAQGSRTSRVSPYTSSPNRAAAQETSRPAVITNPFASSAMAQQQQQTPLPSTSSSYTAPSGMSGADPWGQGTLGMLWRQHQAGSSCGATSPNSEEAVAPTPSIYSTRNPFLQQP